MATDLRIPSVIVRAEIKNWSFGRRLMEARKLAGISQEQMTVELSYHGVNVKHAAVNKWEHDLSQPRNIFDVVEAWAKITDVPDLWLLKGDDGWAAWDSNPEPAEYQPDLQAA
jgi:transcriptional regulator with XRE-family HTH domain